MPLSLAYTSNAILYILKYTFYLYYCNLLCMHYLWDSLQCTVQAAIAVVLGQVHARIRHLRHWRQHNSHRSKVQAQIPLMIRHSPLSARHRSSALASLRPRCDRGRAISSRRACVQSGTHTAAMHQRDLIVGQSGACVIQQDLLLQVVANVTQGRRWI